MKKIDVMQDTAFICSGSIYNMQDKKVISIVDPYMTVKKKGTCKSNSVNIGFISNSPNIEIKYTIVDRRMGEYAHTGITVQYGVSYVYRIIGEEIWHNLDCYCGRESDGLISIAMNRYVPQDKFYEIRVYGPVFSYLSDFVISIDEAYEISPVSHEKKKICFLGGVTTFGAGVTSSALMYTNILQRRYAIEAVNISFYWWNWMDNMKAFLYELLPQIQDCKMFFMECDSPKLSLEVLEHNLKEICEFLLEQTTSKLVLWNQPICNNNNEKKAYIENVVNDFCDRYPNRIVFHNNYYIWKEEQYDEYTNGEEFINDSGNIYIYKMLKSNVEEVC